ncbi:hypothetical protein GCM10027186_30280 [Micromonospora schwarzwaldensis]
MPMASPVGRHVGRHLIGDADGEVLVVNWQAPAAAGWSEDHPV